MKTQHVCLQLWGDAEMKATKVIYLHIMEFLSVQQICNRSVRNETRTRSVTNTCYECHGSERSHNYAQLRCREQITTCMGSNPSLKTQPHKIVILCRAYVKNNKSANVASSHNSPAPVLTDKELVSIPHMQIIRGQQFKVRWVWLSRKCDDFVGPCRRFISHSFQISPKHIQAAGRMSCR